MLEGFVPFPTDFANYYRERGYWQDRSLAAEFKPVFERYADRIAIEDGERRYTYADVDRLSDNLALNLADLGLESTDRVVPTLPNCAEFILLYFALQKLGCIPLAALVHHRYRELSQFVELSDAKACVYPEIYHDTSFGPIIDRIEQEQDSLKLRIVLGEAGPGEHSLTELIERPAALDSSALNAIKIDPSLPCIFQMSGGTTGIPKLIPRTHNDYAYNSKIAAEVTLVDQDSVFLLLLPIAHNLPLACPGFQGFMLNGARVVVSASAKPEDVFSLIDRHSVTHISLVPAILIGLVNDKAIADYDLSSVRQIQSGGQRMQPTTRRKARQCFENAFVQENFGMSEGLLMFVRADDPPEVHLQTCGRPICPDDEVRLVDDEGREVADGEVGELACRGPYTLRGYYGVPDYNAKQFTADGFYLSGDLMRRHPSGNYVVEGRKKDLINRGGEKISAEEIEDLILMHPKVTNVACVPVPDERLGERMCACVILRDGDRLALDELNEFLQGHEIAKYKLPERLEVFDSFPLSNFGKVSKKDLSARCAEIDATEA